MDLIAQVKQLMNKGMYDPNILFNTVYRNNRVHYARVRDAVHKAKVS